MKQKIKFLALLIVFGSALGVQQARAAFDIFMLIPGINGESKAINRAGWIDVYSFSHSISNVTSGFESRPYHAEFVVQKRVDLATPLSNLSLNRGDRFPEIKVEFQKVGENPVVFYSVVMKDVAITSAATHGSAGDDVINETIALSYSEITWTYTTLDLKGKTTTSTWNLKDNKGS